MPIYIKPSHMPPDNSLEAIRSETTHKVLGRVGEYGIYFWERLSNTQYILSWSEILQEYEKRRESLHTQQK